MEVETSRFDYPKKEMYITNKTKDFLLFLGLSFSSPALFRWKEGLVSVAANSFAGDSGSVCYHSVDLKQN